jgi:predicted MPP superfamily phosphohydrolase
MYSGFGLRLILLAFLLCISFPYAASLPDGNTVTYAFVHISDTQNLATAYPETYDLTFSSIESLKESRNISAVIITGDVVNTWDDTREWDAYRHARNLTTIPVYGIAGNHDTGNGNHYQYYTAYTGMPGENYVTTVGDFDLVGINYAGTTYPATEFFRLRGLLAAGSRPNAIVATHYYMDGAGALSPLGKDIDRYLIVRPTLILMGHMHADFIRQRTVDGFPTVADMTNYQDGVPGGRTGRNVSAGTLYTITSVSGRVETIRARVIYIYPVLSFGEEMTVFPPHGAEAARDGKSRLAGVLAAARTTSPSCQDGTPLSCISALFRQILTDPRPR